jgi:hypothetical protein
LALKRVRERKGRRKGERAEKTEGEREREDCLAFIPGISPTNWFRPVRQDVGQSRDHVIT